MSLKTAVFLMSGTYFPSNAHTHTHTHTHTKKKT